MATKLQLKYDYIDDYGKRQLIYEDERGNRIQSEIMKIDNQNCLFIPIDDKKHFVAYPRAIEKDVLKHEGEPTATQI